jgi:hypothetical protein
LFQAVQKAQTAHAAVAQIVQQAQQGHPQATNIVKALAILKAPPRPPAFPFQPQRAPTA